MIDLAPHNPNGLELRSPVLAAPGCGEGLLRGQASAGLGALTTRWARLRAHQQPLRWGSSPAGVVFQGLPEVGIGTLLGADWKRWRRATTAVLLALRGDSDELGEMAQQLERVEGVAGLLFDALDSPLDQAVAALRASTLLPLLGLLPAEGSIVDRAREAAAAGVDALVVRAYPAATVSVEGELVDGVLVGPALLPLTLEALRKARVEAELPLIALGGIAGPEHARSMLAAGAAAVMVDAALHGDPNAPLDIAAAL